MSCSIEVSPYMYIPSIWLQTVLERNQRSTWRCRWK